MQVNPIEKAFEIVRGGSYTNALLFLQSAMVEEPSKALLEAYLRLASFSLWYETFKGNVARLEAKIGPLECSSYFLGLSALHYGGVPSGPCEKPEAWGLRGRRRSKHRDYVYKETISWLAKVPLSSRWNGPARFTTVRAYIHMRDLGAAEQLLAGLSREHGACQWARLAQAYISIDKGEFETAANLLPAVQPDDELARFQVYAQARLAAERNGFQAGYTILMRGLPGMNPIEEFEASLYSGIPPNPDLKPLLLEQEERDAANWALNSVVMRLVRGAGPFASMRHVVHIARAREELSRSFAQAVRSMR